MHLIRVLAFFLSAGTEQDIAFFFIDSEHVVHMVCAFCEIAEHLAVQVAEVEVRPSVPFGPMDEFLAVVNDSERTALDVGVHPFSNDGLCGVAVNADVADVHAFEVAAHSCQPETVRTAEPFDAAEFFELVIDSSRS